MPCSEALLNLTQGVAGGAAGGCAAAATTPLDVVKTRLQLEGVASRTRYLSLNAVRLRSWNCFTDMHMGGMVRNMVVLVNYMGFRTCFHEGQCMSACKCPAQGLVHGKMYLLGPA